MKYDVSIRYDENAGKQSPDLKADLDDIRVHIHCEMCNSSGARVCGDCQACKKGGRIPLRGSSSPEFCESCLRGAEHSAGELCQQTQVRRKMINELMDAVLESCYESTQHDDGMARAQMHDILGRYGA